jgi:hypothetical protein
MKPKLTLIQGGKITKAPNPKNKCTGRTLIPEWDSMSTELQNEILSATAPPETDTFIFKPSLFLVEPNA